MIDFEPVEIFLKDRHEYLFKFSSLLNMYSKRFGIGIQRETINNWENADFLLKVKKSYEFLRLNFYKIVKDFYNKTGFSFIEFPFIPFVGLGVVNEWVDIYKNKISTIFPLENINSVKSLISLIYKNYAFGYFLNINESSNKVSFYNNLRSLMLYGFSNYISRLCSNYSVLVPIWLSQRSIYKIWLSDIEMNLVYYLKKFISEIRDSSLGQFLNWFVVSRRGQYIGYKVFEFFGTKLVSISLEIFEFKVLEFYGYLRQSNN
ncbi:MAG: hypothetical protein RMJ38_05750 [candidate division WOR-3 bacterium]|nr:hypothetical protein [candidate division WOR-3 bacterium]MDW8150927.1 hypothetical protein [candidate division WOR-3 bacterium]